MKKKKRLTIEAPIHPSFQDFFNKVEYFELNQIYRIDKENIYSTEKIKFKDSHSHPKMFEGKFGIKYIEVLREDRKKNEFFCFAGTKWLDEVKKFTNYQDFIIDPPIIIKDDLMKISVICDNENLEDIISKNEKIFGQNFKIVSITNLHPDLTNLFFLLTDRQKEILYYAVKKGYFEIPRKINGSDLADHFKITFFYCII
jgi:hypothetical protein